MLGNKSASVQHPTAAHLLDNVNSTVSVTHTLVNSNETAPRELIPDRCGEENEDSREPTILALEDGDSLKQVFELEAGDSKELILELDNGGNHQPSRGLLDLYADALESGALVTKCITSAVIGMLGDIGAQGIRQACGGHRIWYNNQASTTPVVDDDMELNYRLTFT